VQHIRWFILNKLLLQKKILRVGFFTAAVWCVPALRVPLVHSLINHFRKKKKKKIVEALHETDNDE
jgi:hypothetical protein